MSLSNTFVAEESPRLSEDIDSTCSTTFDSVPSSPGHGPSGYFFSAPASPMSLLHSLKRSCSSSEHGPIFLSDSGSFEFEFSSRFFLNGSAGIGSMTSADELFFNGQIRPIKLSSHLQRPQDRFVPPLADLDLGGKSSNVRSREPRLRGAHHRKARSISSLHSADEYDWGGLRTTETNQEENGAKETESSETTPSCSASSSRSSSSGRNSKKWIFLKDLLHRSNSEGGVNNKERFWSAITFTPRKEKKTPSPSREEKKGKGETKKGRKKPANGVGKPRRVPASAHELHYTANRAQSEEMKKKTYLPYRQGLLGCLGFSSKSYGAFTGFYTKSQPNFVQVNRKTIAIGT